MINSPKVTILTPVYNGGRYLAECIDSILNQKYSNWEYIIINNCSTDDTLHIANYYAELDNRINVVNNVKFVDVIENHNIAFSLVSSDSKYCKIVSADDWLYPECIMRMVEIAERYSTVGIVGAYAINCDRVLNTGLPLKGSFFDGREASRLRLLGAGIFGAPTTILYRADIVNLERPFFTITNPSADIDTTFRVLQKLDFGFVHQILSFVRTHDQSVSSKLVALDSFLVDSIDFLLRYGPFCLSKDEFEERSKELMSRYYKVLAVGILKYSNRGFWQYHRNRIRSMKLKINYITLACIILINVLDWIMNPKLTFDKFIRVIKRNFT